MKKIFLISLSFVFVFFLSACGGATPEAPAEQVEPQAVQEEAPIVEAEVNSSPPVEEPVEAMVVVTEEPTAETVETVVEEPAAETAEIAPEAEAQVSEEMAEIDAAVEPEMVTEATDEPTAEAVMAEEAAAPVDWLTNEGRTDDGFAFLGNPDAPITMIDYSDFL